MRLGDLDALKEAFREWTGDSDTLVYAHTIYSLIDNAPTVEEYNYSELHKAVGYNEGYTQALKENARPQGKWNDIYESHIAYECSSCKRQMPITDDMMFCPFCGSMNMRGGAE